MKNRINKTLLIKIATLFIALASSDFLDAQTTIHLQQVIDSVLRRDPSVQAATLQVLQSRQLQKSSVNLSNPEVLAESPTGEFYTIGVTQSFDFPVTYLRQNQYQKEETRLAGFAKEITALEVKYQVAKIYLNAQYQFALLQLLVKQDSLFRSLSDAADKQFDAGKIDLVQKMFANIQYGELHLKWQAAQTEYEATLKQLSLLSGVSSPFSVEPFSQDILRDDPQVNLSMNPYLNFMLQQEIVSRRLWQVERNRALPGLVVGYLNQGPANTPINFRFRAGITVPLWFWQYNGRMQAARTGMKVAALQSQSQQQRLSLQMITARANLSKAASALLYYSGSGLQQSETIELSAQKLFNAGETDFVTFLRTLNESYSIRFNHLEALRNYNDALLELNFLSCKL